MYDINYRFLTMGEIYRFPNMTVFFNEQNFLSLNDLKVF